MIVALASSIINGVKTYHYIVKGWVQGVAFRYYTVDMAAGLGITGNVRNLASGDVEVYAQGDEQSMAEFELFLRRGPRSARVEELVKEVFDGDQRFSGFDIAF